MYDGSQPLTIFASFDMSNQGTDRVTIGEFVDVSTTEAANAVSGSSNGSTMATDASSSPSPSPGSDAENRRLVSNSATEISTYYLRGLRFLSTEESPTNMTANVTETPAEIFDGKIVRVNGNPYDPWGCKIELFVKYETNMSSLPKIVIVSSGDENNINNDFLGFETLVTQSEDQKADGLRVNGLDIKNAGTVSEFCASGDRHLVLSVIPPTLITINQRVYTWRSTSRTCISSRSYSR